MTEEAARRVELTAGAVGDVRGDPCRPARPDSLTLQRRAEIAEYAARERIPTMYGWTEFVEAGAGWPAMTRP